MEYYIFKQKPLILNGDYLKLNRKIGKVYCRRYRDFEGTIKTVTISKSRKQRENLH